MFPKDVGGRRTIFRQELGRDYEGLPIDFPAEYRRHLDSQNEITTHSKKPTIQTSMAVTRTSSIYISIRNLLKYRDLPY